MTARLFVIERIEDVTGVSGTGYVAEGIEYSDGRCSLRWQTKKNPVRTTVAYDSIDDVRALHGHDDKTRVVFLVTRYTGVGE